MSRRVTPLAREVTLRMAFVRKRTIGSGSVSTALIEAYRDDSGRPRQRSLANLHGEPDTLRALAKLAAMREAMRQERDWLAKQVADANQWLAQNGIALSAQDPVGFLDARGKRDDFARELAAVEAKLTKIEREGAVIKKHCAATPDEIQAAIREYKKRLHDAKCLVLGMEFINGGRLKEAKAKLRQLRR
jgi:hypothetical protein